MDKLKYTNENNLKRLLNSFKNSNDSFYTSKLTKVEVEDIDIFNITPFNFLEAIINKHLGYYDFKNMIKDDSFPIEFIKLHDIFSQLALIYLRELDLITDKDLKNTMELSLSLKFPIIINFIKTLL